MNVQILCLVCNKVIFGSSTEDTLVFAREVAKEHSKASNHKVAILYQGSEIVEQK